MTDGRQEQAIALALRQPFAVGGNAYTWERQRPTRFTHWMAARREWTDRVGLFDETLQRGEDCDWYERLAEAGAKGWFDPSMCSMYYVRPDYRSSFSYAVRNAYHRLLLARQTGRGLSWRHAIPGILAIGALLGLAIPMSRILVYAGVLLYSVALCWSSWRAAEGGRSLMPWIAGAILVHHSGHVIGLVGGAVWMGWRRPPRTP
jgi:GT2 family glycosyltransferase